VAFSPSGKLLAVADFQHDRIVMLRVNEQTGKLRIVSGPRFRTGYSPGQITFRPDGKLLAVVNQDGSSMSIASVNTRTGHLQKVPGSPFGAHIESSPSGADSLAFSPRDGLLAFALVRRIGDSITMFSTH
jgi:DNA-binding beta-propeller fold protein YncE